MALKPNHTCIICGERYHHCNDCSNMKSFMPWRSVACSTECYQAYLIYQGYTHGRMTKEQAAEGLRNSGFDVEKATGDVKEVLISILAVG